MHDGSVVRFRSVHEGYDPTDRDGAYAYVRRMQDRGEVVTGLLYVDADSLEMHAEAGTVEEPLVSLPFESLCPGSAALEALQGEWR